MQHTAVKPPAAAARVPEATVSLYSKPGSRRCVWMSMKPGHTTLPDASIAVTPAGARRPRPSRAMRPSVISTSWTWSTPAPGSSTRPSLMRRFTPTPPRWRPPRGSRRPLRAPWHSRRPLRARAVVTALGLGAGQEEQHRHADGDAIGDLIEDHRVPAVRDLGGQLDAAVDGAGVHDQHVGPALGEAWQREAPHARVLAEGRDQP